MLALAYFLNDYQVFDEDHPHLGLVISNEEVKQIYKMNADQYVIDKEVRPNKRRIIINKDVVENVEEGIFMERLSEAVEFQFIAMINKITNNQIFYKVL